MSTKGKARSKQRELTCKGPRVEHASVGGAQWTRHRIVVGVSWQRPDHAEPCNLNFILDSLEGHLEDFKEQSDRIWSMILKVHFSCYAE